MNLLVYNLCFDSEHNIFTGQNCFDSTANCTFLEAINRNAVIILKKINFGDLYMNASSGREESPPGEWREFGYTSCNFM